MSGMHRHPKERRKARRVPIELDVQLVGLGTTEVEARALNLSAGGFYAVTPRYFAPLTKLEMTLVLPPFALPDEEPEGQETGGEGAEDLSPRTIRAEGIVVRCDPKTKGPGEETDLYALGVAFLHLTPADHRRIEAYVQWRFERTLLESAGT
jgi:c-di-GMP-binding flagellar brake protein YcgR